MIALSALYRAISQQADIAMFAGQYRTAESLLREELNVLKIADKEGKPGDPALAAEHARVKADLASTASGECTERAYLNSAVARTYAKASRYKDLEKTLISESTQYQGCAKLATTNAKKAYIEYIGLVAIEEAGGPRRRRATTAMQTSSTISAWTARRRHVPTRSPEISRDALSIM